MGIKGEIIVMRTRFTTPTSRGWLRRHVRGDSQPRGIALWLLQVGFMMMAAIAVFVAVIAARWRSTEAQMHVALTSAVRTAVASGYANESSQTVQLNSQQFARTFQAAALSELGDTTQTTVACQPIKGVTAACNPSSGAIWFGVPVSHAMAKNGVVDVGAALTGTDTIAVAMVLNPPPVLGIQIPLGTSQVTQINLGQPLLVKHGG